MAHAQPNSPRSKVTRRRALQSGVGAALMLGAADLGHTADDRSNKRAENLRGRIKHSVCSWCFEPMPLETLCRHAAALGIQSVELVEPKDWPVLKKYGLACAIAGSHSFTEGLCDPKNHGVCIERAFGAESTHVPRVESPR